MIPNKRIKNITGLKFGSLTALEYSHTTNRTAYWNFQCVCGNVITTRASTVNFAAKKNKEGFPSCGCKELEQKTKHGYRKATNTHPLYRVYRSMMTRCYNPNTPTYDIYGGSGVTVCDEWKDNPQAFIEWGIANGYQEGLHLDKDLKCKEFNIHPKIYSPLTCQFISCAENVRMATSRVNFGNHSNIRLSTEQVNEILNLYFSGEITNQSELARMYGLKSPSSIARLIGLAKGLG